MSVKSFKTSGVGVDLAPQGLVLINTTSFSAVASQSFNNVFSATYTNYRLVVSFTQNTTQGLVGLRLRASGTDDTGNNYNYGGYYGGIGSAVTRISSASQSAFFLINPAASAREFFTMDLTNTFVAVPARMISDIWQGSAQDRLSIGCSHTQSTSYDGFTLSTSAGTLTGSASLYGYNV
jgi:hypothetical protein